MELIYSGTSNGTVTLDRTAGTYDRSALWKVMATTAATLTLTFSDSAGNGAYVVTIPSTNTTYVDVWADFQKLTVSGGTAAYMVFA